MKNKEIDYKFLVLSALWTEKLKKKKNLRRMPDARITGIDEPGLSRFPLDILYTALKGIVSINIICFATYPK